MGSSGPQICDLERSTLLYLLGTASYQRHFFEYSRISYGIPVNLRKSRSFSKIRVWKWERVKHNGALHYDYTTILRFWVRRRMGRGCLYTLWGLFSLKPILLVPAHFTPYFPLPRILTEWLFTQKKNLARRRKWRKRRMWVKRGTKK